MVWGGTDTDGTRAWNGTIVISKSSSALVVAGSVSCVTGGIRAHWFSSGGAV